MPETPTRLFNAIGTGSDQTLYTSPAATSTVVSSVSICNRDSSAHTFTVAQTTGSGAVATTDYLYYQRNLNANDTFIFTIGEIMVAADTLHFTGDNHLTIQGWGVQIS